MPVGVGLFLQMCLQPVEGSALREQKFATGDYAGKPDQVQTAEPDGTSETLRIAGNGNAFLTGSFQECLLKCRVIPASIVFPALFWIKNVVISRCREDKLFLRLHLNTLQKF